MTLAANADACGAPLHVDAKTGAGFIKVGRFKFPIRADYFAIFNRSKITAAIDAASRLIADPVGRADYKPQAAAASERAALYHLRNRGKFYVSANEQWQKYADRLNLSWMQRHGATAWNSRHMKQFYEDVTGLVRGDKNINNPEAAAVAQTVRELHADILKKMQDAGVHGADEIEQSAEYMMRRFNFNGIRALRERLGANGLNTFVAKAILAKRPELAEADALRYATHYVEAIRKLEYSASLPKMSMFSLKDIGTLRAELRTAGLLDDEIDAIANVMRAQGVEAGHARVKARTVLDETFTAQVRNAAGELETVKLSEMFENDARTLIDIYTRQTAGLIGLAENGFKASSDFTDVIKRVQDEAANNNIDPEHTKRVVQHLTDVYDHILGRPMSHDSHGIGARAGRIARDINYARLMGQLMFAQIAEVGNMIGLAGWRATMKHIPEMRSFIKMAKAGELPDDLAKQIGEIWGHGTEFVGAHAGVRDVSDQAFDQNLSKAENFLSAARHLTTVASGFHSINNVLRQMTTRILLQRYLDLAYDPSTLTQATKRRLMNAGIPEKELPNILEQLKKHTSVEQAADNKLRSIDFEAWQAADPNSADTFRMAVFREARRAVQENDIGETAPWMHGTLGKILTQFRTFMLVAHAKQFLHGLHMRDSTTAMQWSLSMMFAGMSYIAQNSLNYAHDKEALSERLDPWEVAKAAFQRAGFSSLIPATIDSVANLTTGETYFNFGRTTALGTGFVPGNPTYDLVTNKVLGTLSNGAQDLFTDDFLWTKREAKDAYQLMLFSNLYGVRTFLDLATKDLPSHNYLRDPQE